MTNSYYQTLYQTAYDLLKSRVGEEALAKHLSCGVYPKADSLKEVYRQLLEALGFTKRMKETVGPVERLSVFLFGFDPARTLSCYGDKWDKLYGRIQAGPLATDSGEDNRLETCLESFCKGALSGAALLSQLGSINTFKAFMDSIIKDEMASAALPLLLQKEVHGMGFPMACSFLNHVGYPDYIVLSPKVKSLLKDSGDIESTDNYEVLKTLIAIAGANQKSVAQVHKVFFIIGDGRVSEDESRDPEYRRVFLDRILPAVDQVSPTQASIPHN